MSFSVKSAFLNVVNVKNLSGATYSSLLPPSVISTTPSSAYTFLAGGTGVVLATTGVGSLINYGLTSLAVASPSTIVTDRGAVDLTNTIPYRTLLQTSNGWIIPDSFNNSFYPNALETSISQYSFGVSMSSDGNTVVAGLANAGQIVVYNRSSGVWSSYASLTTSDSTPGNLGFSVSISADGNTIAAGSPDENATWIFVKTEGTWAQQGLKLVGSGDIGSFGQGYSCSLSADGNTLAVGNNFDNSNVGASWVFTRTSGVWTQQSIKLIGTGSTGTSAQGRSVSLSADGNILVVGGSRDNSNVGAAWIFTRSAGVWTQYGSKLTGTGSSGTSFGISTINSNGTTICITNTNSIFVFKFINSVWIQTNLITNITTAKGVCISSDGNTIGVSTVGSLLIYTNSGGILNLKRSLTLSSEPLAISCSDDAKTMVVSVLGAVAINIYS